MFENDQGMNTTTKQKIKSLKTYLYELQRGDKVKEIPNKRLYMQLLHIFSVNFRMSLVWEENSTQN